VWAGTVSQCNVEGAEARLTCVPDDVALGQKFPTRVYSAQCQWPLYGPGCGADPTSKTDPVNVTTVSGFTVTSADFALRPKAAGYAFFNIPGSIGRLRMRLPVAAKIAFVTAGAIGGVPGSPTPPGASPLGTRCTSMTGISSSRSTG